MKKIFLTTLILFCNHVFADRFDPNNINEKLFISIKCVGISEESMKFLNKTDTTQEKYLKYFIIDKESNLVLNYYPNLTESFVILRGDWKITKSKVVGFISRDEANKSLVLNFEYDISGQNFKETMIVNNSDSVLTSKTTGMCTKFKSLPKN
jgi:hypothetical protein